MAGIRPDNLSASVIKSRLLNISKTSLYRLTIPVPPTVAGKARSKGVSYLDIDNISLLCHEANLPGSALATHDVTNDYAGVSEKMVYRRMYDESLDLTFYVDRSYKVVEFFESWINFITGVDENFSRAAYKSPYVFHRMSYPDDYKINMYLSKFEKDHHFGGSTTTLDYTFVHAFPISIQSMPVTYEQGQLLKCNVSFSFIRYVMERNGFTTASGIRDTRSPGVPESTVQPEIQQQIQEFDTSRLGRVITNEYYNNGIIRGRTPVDQRQGPGDRRQDATNFTRDIA